MCFFDFVQQYNGAIIAIATIAYVILTFSILKSNKKSTNEITRPYVVPNIFSEDLKINLSITNVGKRPAKDFQIEFTPSLSTIESKNRNNKAKDIGYDRLNHVPMLNQSFIAPGFKIQTMLTPSVFFLEDNEVPRIYTAKYSYKDLNNKKYNETCVFNLGNYIYTEKTMQHTENFYLNEITKNLTLLNNLKDISRKLNDIANNTNKKKIKYFEDGTPIGNV